jgi:hypothetical protein
LGGRNDLKEKGANSDGRLEELRRILAEARRDYDQAKIEYEKAQEIVTDIGGFSNPDGATSFRRATEKYDSSLQRYAAILGDFSEFILGKSD